MNAYIAATKATITTTLPSTLVVPRDITAKTQAEIDALKAARAGTPISGANDPRVGYGGGRVASDGSISYFNPDMLGMTSGGNIPKLAEGGIVKSPTIAMIGEAGAEAVVPLNRMGSMGGATVNVVINGSVTSEGDLVNAIRNALLQGQNNGQAITKTAIQL